MALLLMLIERKDCITSQLAILEGKSEDMQVEIQTKCEYPFLIELLLTVVCVILEDNYIRANEMLKETIEKQKTTSI